MNVRRTNETLTLFLPLLLFLMRCDSSAVALAVTPVLVTSILAALCKKHVGHLDPGTTTLTRSLTSQHGREMRHFVLLLFGLFMLKRLSPSPKMPKQQPRSFSQSWGGSHLGRLFLHDYLTCLQHKTRFTTSVPLQTQWDLDQ